MEPRKQAVGKRRQRFCPGGRCRRAFSREAVARYHPRKRKPFVDFEQARMEPEFQRRVAEIVA